jgi:hypothetical protein
METGIGYARVVLGAEIKLTEETFEQAYDTVYYSHGPVVGPKTCLDDNIDLCKRILSGTDDAQTCEFMGKAAIRAAMIQGQFKRADGKYGNIVYSEFTKK